MRGATEGQARGCPDGRGAKKARWEVASTGRGAPEGLVEVGPGARHQRGATLVARCLAIYAR